MEPNKRRKVHFCNHQHEPNNTREFRMYCRDCYQYLPLPSAWRGGPGSRASVKQKSMKTFSELTSCVEGTAAEKTGPAAARARRTVVNSMAGREMNKRKWLGERGRREGGLGVW